MIHYYEGTVFNTPAKTIVNTVNCFGVMGAGIALEFKLRFPEMFEDYVIKCKNNEVKVGRPKLFKYSEELWIMNFPTKNHWKAPSKINYIVDGLNYFVKNYERAKIDSIAFPKLGTNNGGLDWTEVKAVMEKYLNLVDIDVYICLDEKKEAEGTELKMINSLNKFTDEMLINEIGLAKKQANAVISTIPITRFWKLGRANGIGEKTYEKLFNYFYEKELSIVCNGIMENNKIENQFGEQLSLF
ncbi:MAG: macro domain-containing protein [Sedimentibacter sp.]|jgi:O-acetyl-ADP-ribose deacetylase (regulator of RNase III)|nr:macro domain-containing protein [Sedimentibacter sp.]